MLALLSLLAAASAAEWPVDPVDAPWVSTSSGVEMQDLVAGTGASAVDGSTVSVHYVGMLADGTVFDASRERGQPFRMRIGSNDVIAGWEEGVVGMRVGGKRRLVIPPELGYGSRQIGPIPADSVLYFEVDLLSVTAPRTPPAAEPSVEPSAWREIKDGRVADVGVGTGGLTRASHRVCVDYAVFRDGALAEHTFARRACTWFGPQDDDLPDVVWQGLSRMREGGERLIAAPDGAIWQITLTTTRK